ncbi:MAG: hypothetical protein K0U12_07820 [Gammaproteobacteria bacterium]|nr:hypothetical protein [Gammaproteobacteria bacterium]
MNKIITATTATFLLGFASMSLAAPNLTCNGKTIKLGTKLAIVKQQCGKPNRVKIRHYGNKVKLYYIDIKTAAKTELEFEDGSLDSIEVEYLTD